MDNPNKHGELTDTPLKNPIYKNLFLWKGILIILIIGISITTYLYTQVPRNEIPQENTVSKTQDITNQIAFTNPTKIFSEVRFEYLRSGSDHGDGLDYDYDYTFNLKKVGDIIDGKYKGGELILADAEYSEMMCKGVGCEESLKLRYILLDKKAILLPKISQQVGSYNFNKPRETILKAMVDQNPFEKFGYTFSKDDDLTVPILEYPKTITGNSPDQVLYYGAENDDKIDLNEISKISTNNIFGDIYTSKQHDSIGFYVFRPDGTSLVYNISTQGAEDVISSYTKTDYYDTYTLGTSNRCGSFETDFIVANNTIDEGRDLKTLVTYGKNILYLLKDRNHLLLKEFYEKYKEVYMSDNQYYPGEDLKTYEQFVDSNPIIIWRDPFGRYIRFNKNAYIPVSMCEPIIYLYPEIEQKINVKLNSVVNVFASTPKYNEGWNITAKPSGDITDIKSNKKYPYLFWEGSSYIFNTPKHGFIVEKSNVNSFLEDILPKLGLNEKEKNDFIKAWAPELSEAPYYFITFLNQNFIDKIAPLEISPTPKTIIRVLMDYRPLTSPIDVKPLILPAPIKRVGFTVVEWGGLKR